MVNSLLLGMIKYLYIFTVCGVVSLSAFIAADRYNVPEQEQVISMRRIGHKFYWKAVTAPRGCCL
jgi:hypothetical protein